MTYRSAAALALIVSGCASLLDLPSPTLDDSIGASADAAATPPDATTVDGPVTADDGAPTDSGLDAAAEASCDLSLPKNCGACGVDCSSGQCENGICTLVSTLGTSSLYFPQGIAIFQDDLYIAAGNPAVARCKTNGCIASGATAIHVPDSSVNGHQPNKVVVGADGGALFWTDYANYPSAGVYRTDPSTGATSLLNEGQPTHFATQLLLRDGLVVWGNAEAPGGHFCPLSGCQGAMGVTNTSAVDLVTAVVANDSGIAFASNGYIQTCASPSCMPANLPIASNLGQTSAMALHGKDLIFSVSSPNYEIHSMEFGLAPNGAVTVVASGHPSLLHPVYAMLVVNDTLYWANPGTMNPNGRNTDGTIEKCTLPACATITNVASGQAAPLDLATDGKAIYWANAGNSTQSAWPGEIRKAPL